ncbi:hypothetical protein ANO11243_068550 [Dothideomycetidae sp. 11243]|nr:hypothetical protein ANO11243_068550 [fungal sp. No.11243]
MYRPNDPRLRRTLNEISQTIESANETAQTSVFVFGQQYIRPCLGAVYGSVQPCVETCLPPAAGSRRAAAAAAARRRSRGRPELNFDFYDDWEEDENADLLGWGDEEYDSFVAGPGGYGTTTQQPGRQRAMSYGTRRDAKGRHNDTGAEAHGAEGSSYFGFIGKMASKLGKGKGLRYKPSAAGLQEHPGASKKFAGDEAEPLMTDESDTDAMMAQRRRRNRSGTTGSQQTVDSLSSRGDLFPSEDEDDAIPLDDEFAMVLERRTTSSGQDDGGSSGIIKTSKRPGPGSRRSTRTTSSRSTPRSKRLSRTSSSEMAVRPEFIEPATLIVPTLSELRQEEERAKVEEETAVQQRREAAKKLAAERGLAATMDSQAKDETAVADDLHATTERRTSVEDSTAADVPLNGKDIPPNSRASTVTTSGKQIQSTDPGLSSSSHSSFEAARLPNFGP